MARLEATRRGAEVLDDLSREEWVDARDVEWLRASCAIASGCSSITPASPKGVVACAAR